MVCAAGSNYCNTTITFDTTTNRINSSGYSYDAAGNLLRDGTGTGTHTFEWDAESRMKSVDGGATGTFVYNALGQRVQKTFGGTSVYYYYDGFGNLAMTQNGSAQQLEHYIPGAGAKYVWTGSVWETHYLHGNALGSTQIVTRADSTNSYEEARNFYAFGGLRWQGGGAQDVRFASMQKRDSETVGWQDPLDWTPNRLYSQGFGRWFSPDPLGGDITNPQSLNRYAYVLNNPTSLVDPQGLSCDDPNDGKPCIVEVHGDDPGGVTTVDCSATDGFGCGYGWQTVFDQPAPCYNATGQPINCGQIGHPLEVNVSSTPGTNRKQPLQVETPYCLDVFLNTTVEPFIPLISNAPGPIQDFPKDVTATAAAATQAGGNVVYQFTNTVKAMAEAGATDPEEAAPFIVKFGAAATALQSASVYLGQAIPYATRYAPTAALFLIDASLLRGVIVEYKAARNGECK